jgi:hypothetical protein
MIFLNYLLKKNNKIKILELFLDFLTKHLPFLINSNLLNWK